MHAPKTSPRPLLLLSLAFAAFAVAGTLGACTSSDSYVVVTVDARPAVYGSKSLVVSLSNSGTTRMDSLTMPSPAFPVTFSISAPGRTGDLAIAIDATDDNGLVVGHGTATATIMGNPASIMLDSTDFVVNTDYANDQFPTSDFEAAGFQLAALPDGTWTAAFRDSCMERSDGSCNIFARRFDKLGKPAQTEVSASANAFDLSTTLTTSSSTPAIASSTTTTVAVWDFYDVVGTGTGVACRALDASGRALADQTAVATDAADVVSVAAMSNGNFVASWNAAPAGGAEAIRSVIIKPDCTALTPGVQTVSLAAAADFPHRSSVASSADRVLFAWIVDGTLHTRIASSAGAFLTSDTALVPKTVTEQIAAARVAGVTNGGFVIAARWAQNSLSAGPGRIELFRVSAAGSLVGTPVLVTDKSASDFDNRQAFSIASRMDGTLLVAWHTCGALGDDSMCGVFGRIMQDTGAPVSDVFVIPTTTSGDQKLPSVVGLPEAFVAMWTDASAKPPDVAGLAVRARIIYPPGPPGN